MFIASALSNMETWNWASCDSKLNILQARCDSALSCSKMWKTNYPHRHVNSIVLHVFVAATVKLKIFDANEPDFSPLKQGNNWQLQLGLACLYPW